MTDKSPCLFGIFWLLLFIVACPVGYAFAETVPRSISVVMDDNYPPFSFRDSSAQPQGILIDQWRLWEKKTGVAVKICPMDWGKAVSGMKSGEFDVIDTIFKTEERSQWLDFTKPYAKIEVSIFFDKHISGITDAASLKGFSVADKRGDAMISILKQSGVDNLLLFDSFEEIIRTAKERKVSVFVMGTPPALYFLNKHGIVDRFKQSAPLHTGYFHRGVKKGNSDLLSLVESGFARISPDELKRIETRWYGAKPFDSNSLRQLFGIAGGLVLLLIILSAWNYTLRKTVSLKTAELNKSLETQRANASFLNTLMNTMPDLVWLKNADGIYLSCNRMFERFFGASAADIVGKTDYDFVDRELADSFREHDRKAMLTEGPSSNEEWITFADDGHNALLETIKTPMYDAEGKLVGVLGVGRDITERKMVEEELRRHREHLEFMVEERTSELLLARDAANAASQAKSMFLANMSHEIRTPMNAVLGFAQLLETDPSLSPEGHNKVATIMKSGEHLLSIINDILEMSSIESGRVEIRNQPLYLAGLLEDLAGMFRLKAEEKRLSFGLDLADNLPRYVVADSGKLRQIMINLLGNAVKFTEFGSIVLRAAPAGTDRILLEVCDTGSSISSEEQAKLFRPFERVKSGEQAAGGTGLGLAISREYARLMGGDITLESSAGQGNCFRFVFSAPLTAEAPTVHDISHRVARLAPGQGEVRVLVVDDLDTNRQLLRELLELIGFTVDEAANGLEAIAKAQARPPRVILMDQVMPDMDGMEATRILRNNFGRESLAIIGITANAFKESQQQFFDAGINGFVAKPFRAQELYNVLARHAGVQFEFEEKGSKATEVAATKPPTLENMSAEWLQSFSEALNRKNITRIRRLGEQAREANPVLSAWILERAGLYDLEALKKLGIAN
ncbi:transporter substrate-binding domain-containing protein [Geobacter pelophilus]|uniref:histidine kinase n=1 Tax=Geoanaerobacter pelophilus TaxID=60036 RepID=A0AAW4LC12_9BACT|nr:transporter substrate-binding domain-containing protein [Geoanaerobacter pelophilus]MBT0664721.1 transporter substrate-binding domain-containing protein [Geoanaerobacter pelophilus]